MTLSRDWGVSDSMRRATDCAALVGEGFSPSMGMCGGDREGMERESVGMERGGGGVEGVDLDGLAGIAWLRSQGIVPTCTSTMHRTCGSRRCKYEPFPNAKVWISV